MGILPNQENATALSQERAAAVRAELAAILRSSYFSGSKCCQDFFEFVVHQALDGNYEYLSERFLGAELFGRPINYETGTDSIVRVRANDVRRRLAQFYSEGHGGSQVAIDLVSGSYVPEFHWQEPKTDGASPEDTLPKALATLSGPSHREAITTLPMPTSGDGAWPHRRQMFFGLILMTLVLSLCAGWWLRERTLDH